MLDDPCTVYPRIACTESCVTFCKRFPWTKPHPIFNGDSNMGMRECQVWAINKKRWGRFLDWLKYGHTRHECTQLRPFARRHHGNHSCVCTFSWPEQSTDDDLGGTAVPVYSFGVNSPLKFELSEEFAASFNRVIKCITEQEYVMYFLVGTYLSGSWPFMFECLEKEDADAFKQFPDILMEAVNQYEGTLSVEDIQDIYLVEN